MKNVNVNEIATALKNEYAKLNNEDLLFAEFILGFTPLKKDSIIAYDLDDEYVTFSRTIVFDGNLIEFDWTEYTGDGCCEEIINENSFKKADADLNFEVGSDFKIQYPQHFEMAYARCIDVKKIKEIFLKENKNSLKTDNENYANWFGSEKYNHYYKIVTMNDKKYYMFRITKEMMFE